MGVVRNSYALLVVRPERKRWLA